MVSRDATLLCCSPAALAEARAKHPLNARVALGCEGGPDASVATPAGLASRWTELTRRNPNVTALDPSPEWQEAIKGLVMTTVANQQTTLRHGKRWVEHFVRNLDRLVWKTPAMAVPGCLRGVPAILVGAGPSLAKNKQDIELHRGKALIIGVNSACREVECDVQVCLESNDIRTKLGDGPGIRGYSLVCPPEVIEHGSGLLAPLWSGEIGLIAERMSRVKRIPTSASGTTAALALALHWGCDPIVLVGQDLAYTDGQIYANGGTLGPDGKLQWPAEFAELERPGNPLPESIDVREVPGWEHRQTVLSDASFDAVRRFLSEYPDKGRTLLNATEGGSYIPNWTEFELRNLCWPPRDMKPARQLRYHLEVSVPTVNYRMLRAWRDEQTEGLSLLAQLCVSMQVAPGNRLAEYGEMLLDGLRLCRLLETWSAEGIMLLRDARYSNETRNRSEEVRAAKQDLRDAAVVLAKDAMSLREVLIDQKYEPQA